MTKHILTQEVLKELLHYDPDTGIFTWKRRDRKYCSDDPHCKSWNVSFAGKIAGPDSPNGYAGIKVFGRRYLAHRLSFLYMTGNFPEDHVDHINGISTDNRWCNIRSVTAQENTRNQKLDKRSKTRIPGVHRHEDLKKYRVCIWLKMRKIHLGYFYDFFEACCARKSAEIKYGYHENHGRR